MITLTEMDGIEFKADISQISRIDEHKNYRTVKFKDGTAVNVKDGIPAILDKITEEKRNGFTL